VKEPELLLVSSKTVFGGSMRNRNHFSPGPFGSPFTPEAFHLAHRVKRGPEASIYLDQKSTSALRFPP
jgi:hypothetical protein